MSLHRDHLITYKASEGKECKDIAAGLKIEVRGALEFRIDNDESITHTITVPNSVHIPDLPMVIFYPQHWSKKTSDSIESTSVRKNTILKFQGYMKTIPYSVQSNTPRFCSTFGTLL